MKYCSECGNQLLDEAVICPKCGAAAGPIGEKETPAGKHDKRVRLKTSAALNNIAGILNLLLALFFTWILFGSSSVESGSSEGFTISARPTQHCSGCGSLPSCLLMPWPCIPYPISSAAEKGSLPIFICLVPSCPSFF